MRILLLSSQARDTGSYHRLAGLGRALERLGHDCVLPRPPDSMPLLLHFPAAGARYLGPALDRAGFDLAVISKPYPHTAGLIPRLRARGAFCVMDIDDLDWGFRSGPASKLLRRIQAPYPRAADLVTYHNPRLQQLIIDEFGVEPARLHRLPQGVDLELFDPDRVGAGDASAPGLEGRPYLLWVGNLNIGAELEVLLRAFRLVRRERPDLVMAMAGGGPHLARSRRRARGLGDGALFLGPMPRERLPALIMGAEACLLYMGPGAAGDCRESLKLREYLAMDRPVVCNRGGELAGFGDLVRATDGSTAGLAAAMLEAASGPGPPTRGRAWVRAHCDWDRLGAGLMARVEAARSGG